MKILSCWLLSFAGGQVTNLVLSTYVDAQCLTLDAGEGVQQSWNLRPLQSSICYDVGAGMSCNFLCNLKLTCEYASGSGVMIEDYPQTNCEGSMGSRLPLARHLTWLQAKDFFEGQCTPRGDGKFMAFNKRMDRYPDCSAEGAVDANNADVAYEARYDMTFYTDSGCQDPYQVTATSTFQFNKYQWRVYRGAQHCLDYLDTSVRPSNFSVGIVSQDHVNIKLFCGNNDGLGNGVMVRKHNGGACSGTSQTAIYWRDAFFPMNLYLLQDFFNGECVAWGSLFVKFDRKWDTLHYPDCSLSACKSGYCSGGRLQEPYTGASAFTGVIRTPNSAAQTVPSETRRTRVVLALGLLECLLVIDWMS